MKSGERWKKSLVSGLIKGAMALACAFLPFKAAGAPSFRDVPPTIGAYTLRGGEWEVGASTGIQFAVPSSYFIGVSMTYGITNWFQAGIGGTYSILTGPYPPYIVFSGHAKLRLPLGTDLNLGIPFHFSFLDSGEGIAFSYVQSGAIASLRTVWGLTFHAGAILGLSRGGFHIGPYALVDIDLQPNLKVGIFPLGLAINVWIRLLDILDVELALAPLGLMVNGGVYLRF